MPELIPNTISGTLAWATSHIATWDTVIGGGGTIGIDAGTVTALEGHLATAETDYNAAVTARADSKSATVSQNTSLATLRDQLAIAVSNIRAYAETQANPNAVYAEANIPPRAEPTPAPAPTAPAEVTVSLNNTGDCLVAWRATRVNGDYWSVWRTLAGEASPVLIGTTGAKSFVDLEVPSGTAWAIYSVFSHRGSAVSDSSEPVQILFGTAAAA
ncbi:MAG: hypothetical protein WD716_11130 [Fimbriimonadaceae bacterium]